jgi:hypothetical protein
VGWIQSIIGSQKADNLREKLASRNASDDKAVIDCIRENLTFSVLAAGMQCGFMNDLMCLYIYLEGIPKTYHLPVISGKQDYRKNKIGDGHSSIVYRVDLPNELEVVSSCGLSLLLINKPTRRPVTFSVATVRSAH